MSLPQKYRPASFDEVAGAKNRATVSAIRKLIESASPPHAFLIVGPFGSGKTTISRLIAEALGCDGDDFRELDAAHFRGIDDIRDIRHRSHYRPMRSPCRVWFLDECSLTPDAQRAFLKGLEDPPDHCYYVLATTDPEKLLPTIRSRCSTHQVHLLADDEMLRLLRRVASREGADVPVPALRRVVEAARGHARDALQMLETVIADPASADAVALGASEAAAKSIDLCRALLNGTGGWKKVGAILADLRNEDPEETRRAVMGYCASVLVGGANDRAGLIMQNFAEPTYDNGFAGLVLAAYSVVAGS